MRKRGVRTRGSGSGSCRAAELAVIKSCKLAASTPADAARREGNTWIDADCRTATGTNYLRRCRAPCGLVVYNVNPSLHETLVRVKPDALRVITPRNSSFRTNPVSNLYGRKRRRRHSRRPTLFTSSGCPLAKREPNVTFRPPTRALLVHLSPLLQRASHSRRKGGGAIKGASVA